MKYLFLISTLLLSSHAGAEIYVCKDVKNKVIYQDTACKTTTLRTIAKAPEVSLEDQIKAREIQERARESSRKYQESLAVERLEQERLNLEYEKLEIEKRKLALLESQHVTANQLPVSQYVLNPWYPNYHLRSRYQGQRMHQNNPLSRGRHHPNARAYIRF